MKYTWLLPLVFFALAVSSGAAQGLNLNFAPAVTYSSGGNQGRWVSVADVNGDGKPDLLVVNECGSDGSTCANSTVGVLLGNGDGTFQPAVTYSSGGHGLPQSGGFGTVSLAVGDVNGDGKPDLIVANACATSSPGTCLTNGTVGVLLGNGDGTFQPVVLYDSGGLLAWTVAVADVNGDGKPDIVVADLCGSSCPNGGVVGVLLGNGDGTFQPAVTYGSRGYQSYSVAVTDVNHDGKLDLLVTNLCPALNSECNNHLVNGTVGVLLGNGDGTFQPAVTYSSGGVFARSVAVRDMDGDGKPDLLVANYISNSVGVLLGNGDGTFQPAVAYSSGGSGGSVSVATADVNADGRPDIVVANQCDASGTCVNGSVGVLLGNGDGTFQTAAAYRSGGVSAQSVAVADVSGDGKPDLLVANFCASSGNCSNSAPASGGVLINVGTPIDSTPPTITISASRTTLWPPTGKLVPVTVSGTILDTGSGVNTSTAAYSVIDEYGEIQPSGPITLGAGGNYSFVIPLQASRLGTDKNGRTYTITVNAKDNAGNLGSGSTVVTVPHDQGH